MRPDQRTTGRYQLLFGPWYHLDAGAGIGIYPIELAWFDHWLKGRRTGIAHAGGPLSKEQVDSLVDYLISLKKK